MSGARGTPTIGSYPHGLKGLINLNADLPLVVLSPQKRAESCANSFNRNDPDSRKRRWRYVKSQAKHVFGKCAAAYRTRRAIDHRGWSFSSALVKPLLLDSDGEMYAFRKFRVEVVSTGLNKVAQ